MAIKRKLVAMVTTDIFTPYRKDEIFCVPEDDARKLLRVDNSKNEYGVPRYPKIKVRLFDPERDTDLLLQTGSLNLDDHNKLMKQIHPERPPIEVRMTQYETEITQLLDGLDIDRSTERTDSLESKPADIHDADDDPLEIAKAAQGGGLRPRRGRPSKSQ